MEILRQVSPFCLSESELMMVYSGFDEHYFRDYKKFNLRIYRDIGKEVEYMITVNMQATGANIKNMMKTRNIKVKDVQAVCGFGTPQAIFKWMRGDTMPTIDNMIIIADMFGCTMDDIVVVNK
ncbi:Helix-turn-helix [Lachnospiraceae bacterium NE2001]|nr:Helix-turn-helix [Lachnospiraceae bacterium NE2001]